MNVIIGFLGVFMLRLINIRIAIFVSALIYVLMFVLMLVLT